MLEQGSDEFGPFAHGYTYSAHPLCAAAGIANLELIDEKGLVENAARAGAYFGRAAGRRSRPSVVGEIRGEGMLAAVEFVADREDRLSSIRRRRSAPQVAARLLERGLIARAMPQGDILGFAPPLCLPERGGRHDRWCGEGGHQERHGNARGQRSSRGLAIRNLAITRSQNTLASSGSDPRCRSERQDRAGAVRWPARGRAAAGAPRMAGRETT